MEWKWLESILSKFQAECILESVKKQNAVLIPGGMHSKISNKQNAVDKYVAQLIIVMCNVIYNMTFLSVKLISLRMGVVPHCLKTLWPLIISM